MLEFKKVSFAYTGTNDILKNCNMHITKNEIFFIVGVNGAGKSTFLKLAAGILTPQSGTIEYHVKNPRIGFHQQDVHISNTIPLSVEEIVRMGRVTSRKVFFRKEDHEKVQECLEQVQLHMFAKKNIHSLSRGQYQRVLLARVLASEPDIIIMDEPEEFLDAVSRDTLCNFIRDLSKHIVFLISSHNFDFIFSLANRVVCLTNPYQNQEDHKFFDFLEKQNSTIVVEHICAVHEVVHDR